jgi:hypothetical protein
MARKWPPTNAELDAWRQVGDPEADRFVADHFKKESMRPLMAALVKQKNVAKTDLAELAIDENEEAEASLQELLDAMAERMPGVTDEDIRIGQDLFEMYGPEILMILGCYSLPAAYSAKKGVQVLATTKFLELEPDRRLAETSQIIMDVMTEGLGEGKGGREAAERTRLIHAAIRRLLVEDPDFDTETLGVPINQEDLAATLMTFSYLVLEGLGKMNMRVTDEQAQAFIDTWRQVGCLLGIESGLLPQNVEEAEQLTRAIQNRQVAPSPHGIELLRILRSALAEKTLPGLPSAMMRLFMPAGVADAMEIPRNKMWPPVPDWAIHQLVRAVGTIDGVILARLGRRSLILRDVSLDLLEQVMGWQDSEKGSKERFEIPDSIDWWEQRDAEGRGKVSRILLDTALAGPRGALAARANRKARSSG